MKSACPLCTARDTSASVWVRERRIKPGGIGINRLSAFGYSRTSAASCHFSAMSLYVGRKGNRRAGNTGANHKDERVVFIFTKLLYVADSGLKVYIHVTSTHFPVASTCLHQRRSSISIEMVLCEAPFYCLKATDYSSEPGGPAENQGCIRRPLIDASDSLSCIKTTGRVVTATGAATLHTTDRDHSSIMAARAAG